MKIYSMLLILALVSSQVVGTVAHAQVESQSIENEVDSEIDQLYTPQAKKSIQQPRQQGAVVTQTIVVPQQQQPMQQQPAYQKQPTTFIEASPLSDSKADMIRKNRQNEEMNTETRIVEKLEQSRMEDEKKRAAVLFGDKFDTLQNGQAQQQPAAPVAPPVVQAPPPQPVQPVYIEPKETLTRDAVREEVRAALTEDETAVTAPTETRYFAGLAGIGEYPDVKNVKGNYSLGAAFGTRYDYLMVEGSFLMSSYSVDLNNYATPTYYNAYQRVDTYDVDQYTGAIAAKYQLLGGVVRPVLGGLIAYSYRKFTLTNGYSGQSNDTGYSHAIDLGVNAGVDLEFSPKFSLGLEMKYMFNMSSRVTANYANSSYGYIGTPIEKLQYYIAGIAARVNF
jgi:Ni/Co efflux regulator RcnB